MGSGAFSGGGSGSGWPEHHVAAPNQRGNARAVGCMPARPVSVLAIQGTADPVVPFNGGPTDIIYAPFDEVIGVWRDVDGCESAQSTSVSGPTTITTWPCRDGTAVQTRIVAGGGHAWPAPTGVLQSRGPGVAFDASRVIADFFVAHRHASSTPPA